MSKRSRNKKKPKQAFNPSSTKSVKQIEDHQSTDKQTVGWRISDFDYGGSWGDEALEACDFQELVRGWAHNFETQKWGDLLGAAGGRCQGNNHHPINAADLSKSAQGLLQELHKDDLVESIFSFRISGTTRLYGIRDGRIFNALWYDPWHGDAKKAVCPAKKRRT